ncbi:MAG: cytochrome c3 family protein, partial [Holophagae bacterium]
EIDWPTAAGARQRPVVEFNHGLHAETLKDDGCVTCHQIEDDGFLPSFKAAADIDRREPLMDAYHDGCTGCHVRRSGEGLKSGPVTCGECHVKRDPGVSLRVVPIVDLSLHARHVKAYPDDCGRCHHVLDEATDTLVYRKNTEEACRGCHTETAVDDSPSLRDAVHRDCVGCHLERVERAEDSGPVRCVGCHDEARLAEVKRLDEVPRLDRGQADLAWVEGLVADVAMVPFDHKLHEGTSSTCSSCHHDRMRSCIDCHTLQPGTDGGGVGLHQAHHEHDSTLSCVGCHLEVAGRDDCAGCHRDTTLAAGGESSCAVCHRGPKRRLGEPPPVLDSGPSPVVLAELPAPSDDLPDEVTIDLLSDAYQGSKLPHMKIIRRLDGGIRASSLASRFHGSLDVMCSGCHHHSPVGQRPPRCVSCHGNDNAPTVDRPSLKVAYHRQCVECHQRLGLKTGCTDCHPAKEGTS